MFQAQLKAVSTFYRILYNVSTPKEIFDDYIGQVIDLIHFNDKHVQIVAQKTLTEICLIFLFKTEKQQKAMEKLLNEYGSDIYIECLSIDKFDMNANLYETCIADQPVMVFFFSFILIQTIKLFIVVFLGLYGID